MKGAGRYVLVSTFPPLRDGIARYADQLAESRKGGRDVIRVGLPGSDADCVVRLDGNLRPLRLIQTTRREDEVVLMWHPEFYISGRAWSRAAAYLSLGTVLRARRASVVVHEPDAVVPRKLGLHRRLAAGVERAAQMWCWRAPAKLLFHSESERREFAKRFAPVRARTAVISHGAHFQPYSETGREAARRALGLDLDKVVFLCIGFLGPHKGFDLAIHAFRGLPARAACLYVVGSPLYESAEIRDYILELRALAAVVPGVTLIERFLEDAEFDLWVSAADAVLAPYRSAASSGVIARATLLGTTVVASRVGGLPEQLGVRDVVIDSEEDLGAALSLLATAPLPAGAQTIRRGSGP